jgi:hypothetical protein
LCKGQEIAEKVAFAMTEAYRATGIPLDIHISKINPIGVKEITN